MFAWDSPFSCVPMRVQLSVVKSVSLGVIELTVGRYLTPSGKTLDGVGIDPDVLVSTKAGSATAEQRALEVIRGLVAASDTAQRG